MGNIAISIDKQIEKLKSRRIDFEDYSEQKIKEILLDLGYYRLGFYWYDLRKKDVLMIFYFNRTSILKTL
jgi:abortive infection bacteriophage resistance protein